MKNFIFQLSILLVALLAGCKAYKQDIMFQLGEDFQASELRPAVAQAEGNYKILEGDKLQVDVFTNGGERLVDPNFELMDGQNLQQANQMREKFWYLVQADGSVKLPMVGKLDVAGLTIDEAEDVLEQAYDDPYVESFVKVRVMNRRVIVLGPNGGQVVLLENENMSLVEVLALYGGLSFESKSRNIRIIRGDLSNPEVYPVDLSTIDGMKKSIMDIQAGDVIYVEPWKRPWRESIKDIAPVVSLVSSTITIILVISKL